MGLNVQRRGFQKGGEKPSFVIAVAGNPTAMAQAFKQAVEAGRMAHEAGLGLQADSFVAEASSPLTAFLNE